MSNAKRKSTAHRVNKGYRKGSNRNYLTPKQRKRVGKKHPAMKGLKWA